MSPISKKRSNPLAQGALVRLLSRGVAAMPGECLISQGLFFPRNIASLLHHFIFYGTTKTVEAWKQTSGSNIHTIQPARARPKIRFYNFHIEKRGRYRNQYSQFFDRQSSGGVGKSEECIFTHSSLLNLIDVRT